jgi:transcriptional regulator with XRE-family HTH domain
MNTINQRIKYIIDIKNYSVASFAEFIGVLQQTLNNYITKDREPSISTVVKILKKFNDISGDWLLTGEGEMLKTPISTGYNTNIGGSNSGVVLGSGASTVVNNLHAEKNIKPDGTIEGSSDNLASKDIEIKLINENKILQIKIVDLEERIKDKEERIKDKDQIISLYANFMSK